MIPNDICGRLGWEFDSAGEIDCTTKIDEEIRTTNHFRHGLCNNTKASIYNINSSYLRKQEFTINKKISIPHNGSHSSRLTWHVETRVEFFQV